MARRPILVAITVTLGLLSIFGTIFFSPGAGGAEGTPTAVPTLAVITASNPLPTISAENTTPQGGIVVGRIVLAPGEQVSPHKHIGAATIRVEAGTICYTLHQDMIEVNVWVRDVSTATPAAGQTTCPAPPADCVQGCELVSNPGADASVLLQTGDMVVQLNAIKHSYVNVGSDTAVLLFINYVTGTSDPCVGGCG